ncbi:hypothetical protein MLD38_015414 [Melastoma candidum]|uniref:Uncharacterized protein n=1 Tax=Melastoma candidum TaxID=119954 RepID=A0ACB9RG15_9MYRT|nr:hypothetical protein MLD38_015414 [Melastoma candidum]
MYGVSKIPGIDGEYRGFYAKNTVNLTPKVFNDIHKRGDGTQRGAGVIYEEIRRRGLKVSVVGIPKTIDNDIPYLALILRSKKPNAQ